MKRKEVKTKDKEFLSADEIRTITKANLRTRRDSDTTKMITIMKNIKERAGKGFYYLDVPALMSYAMAKFLLEKGYELMDKRKPDKILKLNDFDVESGNRGIRVSWDDRCIELE